MEGKRVRIAGLLRQRFFGRLHLGLLHLGAKLPSVRELASELDADPRVVLGAYRDLEQEGLVELRPRSGIYFSPTPSGPPGTRASPLSSWVVETVARALDHDLPAPQFADRFHSYLSTLRLRAACIECNADQTSALCAELASDYGLDSVAMDIDELVAESTSRPELRRVDLLVTTHFHASEVQAIAERLGKPWIAVEVRTDIFAEIATLLPVRPVYFVVTDARYARKLKRIFASTAALPNFHALVLGRDDVGVIPEGAPVYITAAARAHLDDARLLRRVVPEPRTFSSASARALLRFIIEPNILALSALDRA